MTATRDAFELFLTRITPTATQMDAAMRGHRTLREFLEGDPYFGSQIVTTFLNGSYARKTVINPIRDVDVIVVVGPEWLEEAPAKAMESLRRKLAQSYDDRRTRGRRRAVQIRLSVVDFDVVLAVAINGLDATLRIPDRNRETWIETHPNLQLELAVALNKATEGNYVRLVRLLKAWATQRVAADARPKSFVLECLAYAVMREHPASFKGEIDAGFIALLDGIRRRDLGESWLFASTPRIPDPALPRVDVAERWSAESVRTFKERVSLALRRVQATTRARWEDTELKWWQDVFGEPFPSIWAVERWLRETRRAHV
jgi:hypothetical protein